MKPLTIAEKNLVVRLRRLSRLSRAMAKLDPNHDRAALLALATKAEETAAKVDAYVGGMASTSIHRTMASVLRKLTTPTPAPPTPSAG